MGFIEHEFGRKWMVCWHPKINPPKEDRTEATSGLRWRNILKGGGGEVGRSAFARLFWAPQWPLRLSWVGRGEEVTGQVFTGRVLGCASIDNCTRLIVSPKLEAAVVQVNKFLGQWVISTLAHSRDPYELGKP